MRTIDTHQHRPAAGQRFRRQLLALGPGHTLVELLIVLAVCAVLAGAAVPAYQTLLARQRLQAAANDLAGAIQQTRSLAIASGGVVVLAAEGEGWERGWQLTAGGKPIDSHGPLPDGLQVRTRFSSAAAPDYLAYNGAGRSCKQGNSQAARWGTLTLDYGGQQRHIKINMLGRMRVCDPARQPVDCTGIPD